jgi:hypothetical protein
MRKLLLGAAVLALPVGILASTAGVASAKGGPPGRVDVSNASISCTTVTGSANLAPIVGPTVAAKVNSKISVSLSGCTVSGASGTITSITGSGHGVFHANPPSGTAGLPVTAPLVGKITIHWTASSHLSGPKSVLRATSVTASAAGDGNVALSLGGLSVSGDFAGTDGGASSSVSLETTQSLSDLTTAFGTTGIHSLGLTGSASLG